MTDSTPQSSATTSLGKPRPLGRVVVLSLLSGLAYYGYYKWMIQDELKRYTGRGLSGAAALLPFLLGVTVPPALAAWDPDVPSWFGWLSVLGLAWIYGVQFDLYRTVNRLYREAGLGEPLPIWCMFVPGLNIWVGLRQIHFLSEYWAMQRQETVQDPFVKRLAIFFAHKPTLEEA